MGAQQFLKGMDISFVNEIEEAGGKFYINETEYDILEILKESGVNSIRLRLWHTPTGGYHTLEKTLAMAKRIKKHGFHFLLNFHYSDYWADPGKQTKPKAWDGLTYPELLRAVQTYTTDVITEFKKHDVLPDMVQIGNEIISGMLWDDGRVTGEWDTEEQWEKLAELVSAGIAGLNQALDKDDEVEIMLHIDRGGDNQGSRKFYDYMEKHRVVYDIIGLSYYPWWHGTLEDLTNNLNDLSRRYQQEIVLVEIAYPWTLSNHSKEEFIVHSEEQLLPKYPATVEGQSQYLRDLIKIVKNIPNDRGKGVYYWEPSWIPFKEEWSVGHENNWANLTLFDFDGRKLPSLDVFKES